MNSDRELLELAAKAAGLEFKWDQPRGAKHGYPRISINGRWAAWNPLTENGDAFQLAVRLDIYVMQVTEQGHVAARVRNGVRTAFNEPIGSDPYAASRRAIVRAAAEIGRKEASNER